MEKQKAKAHYQKLHAQGKTDEAVMTLRNTYHMNWEEADKYIRRWKEDELGLKLYLLKMHVQSHPDILPVGTQTEPQVS